MINLKRRLGLDVFLEKDNSLGSKSIKLPKADIRTFNQIKSVLLKPKTNLRKFYYMYRDVAPNPSLKKYNLRFDITVIPHHEIGKEEIKTTGHYHAHVRKTNLTYPEVYQVIHGTALYILQKKTGSKITDVVAVEAKPGNIVIVPPNYGHITINPSKETLVMANIVYGGFKSQYKGIEKKHGAAYYVVERNNKISFVINPNYGYVPKLRFGEPNSRKLKSPIYADCAKNPEKYLFLVKPQKYKFTI